MFNITDTEVALALRYSREHDATVSHAQAIVDSKNASIDSLKAAMRALLAELEDERAKRMSAELRLKRILDMPLN